MTMADLSTTPPRLPQLWKRLDKVWLGAGLVVLTVAVLDSAQFGSFISTAVGAFMHTLPFLLFAILAVAYLKATGAENMIARAFEGRELRMIVVAAAMGGLSPFCSCEVIPFVAGLLAVGAPLSAVMAFWLSSPLMDPAMFLITSGELGLGFAVAKTISAVMLGLVGGLAIKAVATQPAFSDPLRADYKPAGCGCGANKPYSGKPEWSFWTDADRRETFRASAVENFLFLGKWMAVAYVLESLMIHYVPASLVAQVLGGEGMQPVFLGALIGGPAYLNGYAAVPLVGGLLDQGMAPGAAMSFVIAGGVSCVPAAVAVWAVVNKRVFAAYLGLGFVGALTAGLVWNVIA